MASEDQDEVSVGADDLSQERMRIHTDRRRDFSHLELLPDLVLRKIVKMLGTGDLKSLRLTSRSLRSHVEVNQTTLFKSWNLRKKHECPFFNENPLSSSIEIEDLKWLSSEDLLRFSREVETIKVVKISMIEMDVVEPIKVLIEMHPELEEIYLGLKMPEHEGSFKDMIGIFGQTGSLLKGLTLYGSRANEGLIVELVQDNGFPNCLVSLEFPEFSPTPAELAKLIVSTCRNSIKELRVGGSDKVLVGSNPDHFTYPVLEKLDIAQCNDVARGRIAWILSHATRLKVLRLKGIDQPTLDILMELPPKVFSNLEDFLFDSYNNTTHVFVLPSILNKIGRSLKVLAISRRDLSEEVLATINLDSFPKLENVNLSYCESHATDRQLAEFIKNTGSKLAVLNLSYTNFTGEFLKNICLNFSPKLSRLDLGKSKLTEVGFAAVMTELGSTLKVLDLSRTKITGESISKIKLNVFKLETLSLCWCKNLTENGATAIIAKFGSTLKNLDLSGTNITGENINEICLKSVQLEKLNLAGCDNLTEKGLTALLTKFGTTVKDLILTYTKITGEKMTEPILSTFQLQKLNLEACWLLTDTGLAEIITTFGSTLKYLNLSNTNVKGEYFSQSVFDACPRLQHLNLEECSELTDSARNVLMKDLTRRRCLCFHRIEH